MGIIELQRAHLKTTERNTSIFAIMCNCCSLAYTYKSYFIKNKTDTVKGKGKRRFV